MKLLWQNNQNGIGVNYGYTTQNREMKKALLAAGVELTFDEKDDFDFAVYIGPPDYFRPIPGKRNICYTMCETTPLVHKYRAEVLKKADLLVVPCQFCKREYAAFYPELPIEVCREGADPAAFPFCERREPYRHEPFRFLWVGAWSLRKGYQVALQAWQDWLRSGRMPVNAQLYFKTSGMSEKNTGVFLQKVGTARPGAPLDFYDADKLPAWAPELPSIVFDTRNLPAVEMLKLYQSAAVFILPSYGEGWGLSLNEALATGAPSIWTPWSGPEAFADDSIGFPVTYHLVQNTGETRWPEMAAQAEGLSIIQRFEEIYYNYPAALAKGKKASERMHKYFTWDQAALEFRNICRKYAYPMPAGAKA